MARIGVLGGSFDPFHRGHLGLALSVHQQINLDEIWFIPVGIAPHKKGHLPMEHRLNMVEIGTEDYSFIKVVDHEIKKNSTGYTYETLKALRTLHNDHEFCFIMGSDLLFQVESWYKAHLLLSEFSFVAVLRAPGEMEPFQKKAEELMKQYQGNIQVMSCYYQDISSSMIREALKNKSSIDAYVPNKVAQYILQNNLYEE